MRGAATSCSPGRGASTPARRRRLRQPPVPAPPLDARPKRFSVTEIETLRRDPYAVYARRHAGWRRSTRCCATRARPSAARCSMTSCSRFTEAAPIRGPADAEDALIAAARERFRRSGACRPTSRRSGGRAFSPLAKDIVRWERERRARVVTSRLAEVRAERYVGRRHRRHAVGLCRPHRPLAGRHGRHPRLQDRLVALQGAGAHADSRRSWRWRARC